MTSPMPARFTILTPTYNRAHTLPRTYASLKAQALLPYEWIVVDDGSTDGTAELVRGWMAEAPFPIRYIHQENAGKPAAHNAGVAAATGDLLAVLDADDWILPHALERLDALWQDIPETVRGAFTGITVNCQYEDGGLVGQPFPESPVDSTLMDMAVRGCLHGDKWGFHRVDVLRAHPFPSFPGEKFVPEGLVWNRIGRRYRMRFVNETLKVVDYQHDGITRRRVHVASASPRGMRLYYLELAEAPVPARVRAAALANAVRFGTHGGTPLLPAGQMRRFLPLAAVSLPVGWLAWLADSIRIRVAAAADPAGSDRAPGAHEHTG